MWGFTNSGGSDLLDAVAIIAVSYPEGSTCTCSNGAVTLTAGNTYGAWAFGVPSVGTWTISATLDEQTVNSTVDVAAFGQGFSVTLTFERVLFDRTKDEFSTIQNKLLRYDSWRGSVQDASPYVKLEGGGYYYGWTDEIDFSLYSTIVVTGYGENGWGEPVYGAFGITAQQPTSSGIGDGNTLTRIAEAAIGNSAGEYELDISAVNRNAYIFVGPAHSVATTYVQKVVLRS